MHSNVTIKNVSWPHFSWATLYIVCIHTVLCVYVCYMRLINTLTLTLSKPNIWANDSLQCQSHNIQHTHIQHWPELMHNLIFCIFRPVGVDFHLIL